MYSVSASKSNILLIATTSYAGMGPYVASIINSFSPEDNVRFFLVEREDCYYSKNIRPELIKNATIIKEKTPSKLKTLYNITIGNKLKSQKLLFRVIQDYNINLIHDLTGMTYWKLVKKLADKYNYLYTVHDLYPHEAKKAFYKEWRQNVFYKRTFKAIDCCKYLLTNSSNQLKHICVLYPNHKSYFADFPSLITERVKQGNRIPPEIINEKDYILFFGRIERYKGLDILMDAFNKCSIPSQIKLVIAGKGDLNIRENKGNIIFINRYIDDEEISYLYRTAACVVYPYISATQSGVLSVASYFGSPIIASDLSFFREVLGNDYGFLFHASDDVDLATKLTKFFSDSRIAEELSQNSFNIYNSKYNTNLMRNELMSIYHQILK